MCRFSKTLKELRINKGLTQEQIGKAVGFGKMAVSYWENKGKEPSYDTLWKLADFFNVTIDYLVGREDELGNKILFGNR